MVFIDKKKHNKKICITKNNISQLCASLQHTRPTNFDRLHFLCNSTLLILQKHPLFHSISTWRHVIPHDIAPYALHRPVYSRDKFSVYLHSPVRKDILSRWRSGITWLWYKNGRFAKCFSHLSLSVFTIYSQTERSVLQ